MVKEIDESIYVTELSDFWTELINRIDLHGFHFQSESPATKVVNRILECCNENTKENLAIFLKQAKYDLVIVALYPNKINFLNYSSTEIREIWRVRILRNKFCAFSVYATLLRNSLIPVSQITEANSYMIDNITDFRPSDNETHLALSSNGFGDLLFERAIQNDRLRTWYGWVQPRADMIAYYIECYQLRDETVEVICEMYQRSNYSHWLGERLVLVQTSFIQKKILSL